MLIILLHLKATIAVFLIDCLSVKGRVQKHSMKFHIVSVVVFMASKL